MSAVVKACQCGRIYDGPAWAALPVVGTMPDGDGGWLDLRNCACASTISIAASCVAIVPDLENDLRQQAPE